MSLSFNGQRKRVGSWSSCKGILDCSALALLSSLLQIPSLLPLQLHFLEEDGAGATGRGSSVFSSRQVRKSDQVFLVASGSFPSAHFYLRDKPLALLFIVSHEIGYHFRAPLSSFQMPLTHFA